MFGFSFSELVVLVVVAIVVIGPKDLPKVLRKLGQYAGKARRMAADLRAQSGIDDVLRGEGLSESVQEIRKLARGELSDLNRSVRYDGAEAKLENQAVETRALRDREYPRDGADCYGALPDTALVYEGTLPKSDHRKDPLWMLGDKDGIIPPDPEPEHEEAPGSDAAPEAEAVAAAVAQVPDVSELPDVVSPVNVPTLPLPMPVDLKASSEQKPGPQREPEREPEPEPEEAAQARGAGSV